jgi:3-deoxy-manno-octulosonate cytidylyltransferase (CMP-KDO synthetase)
LIEQTAQGLLLNPEAGMSSICSAIDNAKDAFDPNVVKVVLDGRGFAMYFSRAAIPWDRELYKHGEDKITDIMPVYRHIGMYGYRVSFLQKYTRMSQCPIEKAECLEQLRALWYGEKIHMGITTTPPGHGVDTPDDIARVEELLRNS